MRRIRVAWRRLVGFLHGSRFDRELDNELRSHLQLHIDDNIRAGLMPHEARRRAILALGGIEQTKEQYRDQRGMPALTHVIRDARYGLRTLRRNPGFAAAAIVTLGLGLGANMAMFRFVDAVLLKSLPVPNPEELVLVRPWSFSYPAFRQFAARNADMLAGITARWPISVNATLEDTTEYLPAELVSGSYFATLRVKPAIGRLLTAEDDGAEGAHPVCVISYGLWQRRFSGDPAVVGRTIELNAKPFEIVGVSEEGFSGASLHARHELQIPMSMTKNFAGMERDSHGWSWLTIFGRLAPGVSREQADAVVRAKFESNLEWQKRELLTLDEGRQGVGSLRTQLEDPVLIAQLLSGCVLLIACANLASLLLAKTSARRHEIAIRRSLGASRGRLISQMIVESLLLAGGGAAVGAGLAVLLDRLLAAMLSAPGSDVNLSAVPSPLGLGVSFGLMVLAALSVGLLPAMAATGEAPLDGLRGTPRAGSRAGWLGRGLVVAQVVACLVLVFAAGLFARSLHNLRAIDLGLDPRQVVVMTTDPERSGYPMARRREFYAEWVRRARLVPGVSSVGLASVTAMSGGMFAGNVTVPEAEPRSGPKPNNNFNVVTPDYFQTVRLPVLAGRPFTDRDDADAPAVAMVNERFAEYYWPGRSPIGRRLTVFRKSVEIVGLVRTAKYRAVREDPEITVYFPVAQRPVHELTLHARVIGSTTAAAAALMETARATDPRVPVYSVGVLEDHVNARLANERVLNVLSILFASLALLVACAGLYGLVAYAVVRRTREIGIRLALGAQRQAILSLFVKDAVLLVGIGIALGMPLSIAVGRQFNSVLYGLESSSVTTLLFAAAMLALVAAAAAGLPAARAARVDPIGALREQ
jgi:predicted permease